MTEERKKQLYRDMKQGFEKAVEKDMSLTLYKMDLDLLKEKGLNPLVENVGFGMYLIEPFVMEGILLSGLL